MKERPILFSAPMVRAILEGRKTQTRRVGKCQMPGATELGVEYSMHATKGQVAVATYRAYPNAGTARWGLCECPYGIPGDRLWVKETFAYVRSSLDYETGNEHSIWQWEKDMLGDYKPENLKLNPRACYEAAALYFAADGEDENPSELYPCIGLKGDLLIGQQIGWTPSIFMRRWMSRILLLLANVRVERLQQITEADAIAEGIEQDEYGDWAGWKNYLFETAHPRRGVKLDDRKHKIQGYASPLDSYRSLWESINGPGSWAENPYVWVITFSKLAAS